MFLIHLTCFDCNATILTVGGASVGGVMVGSGVSTAVGLAVGDIVGGASVGGEPYHKSNYNTNAS